MKFAGEAVLDAPANKVWEAINDPAVLARTIPGCQQLEETAPDEYTATVYAGVASIKGTFLGKVQLRDKQEPTSLSMVASGSGGPGTIEATCNVAITDLGDGRSRLDYDADAVVGGAIGGVGQRMLQGVSKKMATQFFGNINDVLTGKAVPVPVAAGAESKLGVYAGVAGPSAGGGVGISVPGGDFAKGAVVGAVIALAGVLVGILASRRR